MSRQSKVSYICRPFRDGWVVYRVFEKEDGRRGEVVVKSHQEKADAERSVARLNGWKAKENTKGWFEYFRNSLKN